MAKIYRVCARRALACGVRVTKVGKREGVRSVCILRPIDEDGAEAADKHGRGQSALAYPMLTEAGTRAQTRRELRASERPRKVERAHRQNAKRDRQRYFVVERRK